MQRSSVPSPLYSYQHPAAVLLSDYQIVNIAPVVVCFHPGNHHAVINPQAFKKFADLWADMVASGMVTVMREFPGNLSWNKGDS
jgi:hypothetical protein